MTESEIITVVDHKKRGGRVQGKDGLDISHWINYLNPTWDFSLFEYRIHPEEQVIIDLFNNGGEVEYIWKLNDPPHYKLHEKDFTWDWKTNHYRIKPKEDEHVHDFCGYQADKGVGYYFCECGLRLSNEDKIEVPEKWGLKGRGISIDESMRVYQDVDNEIIEYLKHLKEEIELLKENK